MPEFSAGSGDTRHDTGEPKDQRPCHAEAVQRTRNHAGDFS